MFNKQLLINRPRLMLIILVSISSLIYLVDYLVDGSLKEVTTSFLGNLAFLPICIIVVTLTMEQLLKERERHPYLFSLAVRMNPMAEQVLPHLY